MVQPCHLSSANNRFTVTSIQDFSLLGLPLGVFIGCDCFYRKTLICRLSRAVDGVVKVGSDVAINKVHKAILCMITLYINAFTHKTVRVLGFTKPLHEV